MARNTGSRFKDKAAITVSCVSLLISGASLAYTVLNNWRQTKEALLLHVEARSGSYQTEILGYEDAKSSVIVLDSTGVLENIGSVPVSVMDYQLYELRPSKGQYLLMDQGIHDQSGERLALPVALEPGHSVTFVVKTGISIPASASKVLSEEFPSGTKATLEVIAGCLLRHGMDLLGRPIRRVPYSDGSFGIRFDDSDAPIPSFSLVLRTARGNRFEATFCPVQFLGAF